MKQRIVSLFMAIVSLPAGNLFSQTDTIFETFNGICDHTVTPYKNYIFDYKSETGVHWKIKTYYVPEAGGLDDEGNKMETGNQCGTLFWTTAKPGYARATIDSGISTLSFQVMSGWLQKKGRVKVMVDDILIGQTDPIEDREIHTYTFVINTPGPLELELSHAVEGSGDGGILVDNLKWTAKEGTRPFVHVEDLEEYHPLMDTLESLSDTVLIHFYAEGCLSINGKFIEYFDGTDTSDVIAGSVIDLNPGDSCNIYYWGMTLPGSGVSDMDLPVALYLPVNAATDTVKLISEEGGNSHEGRLSFINGNVKYDLVVFKLPDLKHEYRIRYAYDLLPVSTIGLHMDPLEPSVEFYPNPVQNHAYFRTSKELVSFEVLDLNGRILDIEFDPLPTANGEYRLSLESLDTGIWIIRFHYADKSMDALKILVD